MSTGLSRKNLSGVPGAGKLWRSLDELANTPAFEEMVHREFPDSAAEWDNGTSRRTFLKLMSASLALAGFTGCYKKPEEKIVPYVRQPEELIPGKALYFASAIFWGGYARGVLVESHEGRPTKIEGNPDHPASLGATDAVTQAALLNLYDPDRSQTVTHDGETSSWNTFTAAMGETLAGHVTDGGGGLRVLTGAITSPTLAAQMRLFQRTYSKAVWHQYEPVGRDNAKAGAKLATGQDVQAVYRFNKAKVIVSLDSNFLIDDPGSIRFSREFIDGRRVRGERRAMNRLYVAESTPSLTGAMADNRMRLKPSLIEGIARALLAAVTGTLTGTPGGSPSPDSQWVAAVAKDLAANRGAGLVVAGENQPPAVHALAHAINAAMGNVDKTLYFIDQVEASPVSKLDSLKTLVADMNAGSVKTLIILGNNPVYSSPADLDFEAAMKKVPLRVHHASHVDETSFYCHWHIPATHELEMWSDGRAYDGTACIVQPLIAPLYQGRSAHEVMNILNGQYARSGYEALRDHWKAAYKGTDFEAWWTKALNDGVIADDGQVTGTTGKARSVTINPAAVAQQFAAPTTQPTTGMEVLFRPDPTIRDGRHANNGWLQELPKPLTKLTWDNAAMMSAKTAQNLGVIDVNAAPGNTIDTSIVELTLDGRTVKAPAWIVPGQPDDVITVHLGYGRTRAGRVGNNAGFSGYKLRTSDSPWFSGGLTVTKINETMPMACVQNHAMMNQNLTDNPADGSRDLIHIINVNAGARAAEHHEQLNEVGQDLAAENAEGGEHRKVSLSLYPERHYPANPTEGNKWGMVIDQNACIGCNACVAACVAENNIPVVGKEQVAKGREMHWLRIDTYFSGDINQAEGPYFQPLPCMHCENAPCEVVCPVGATVHDAEGLNNMVYNRCVGTRYCSNNCPYKVRHFNFLHYTKEITQTVGGSLALMMNPNVTVRSRGVMEKCTYCVQRINAARIDSKKADQPIKDGEVVTACQQSCPTQAITFGNLNDPKAKVFQLANDKTNYGLLDELQTKPRTTYLPRYTNPAFDNAKDEGAFF
jgi:MoCo/4Fe-4S cofactor protein with predicted Tat translocation signal